MVVKEAEGVKEQMTDSTKTTSSESSVSETVANLKGIPTKEELIALLREEVVQVTFTKLDGDTRIMPCTLKAEYFPDPKKNAEQRNEKTVSVWAVESNGFRSFRYDRVKEVKVIDWKPNADSK